MHHMIPVTHRARAVRRMRRILIAKGDAEQQLVVIPDAQLAMHDLGMVAQRPLRARREPICRQRQHERLRIHPAIRRLAHPRPCRDEQEHGVRRIEEAIILTLRDYGLQTERHEGAPGIYIRNDGTQTHAGAKIAALGLKVKNGCTYHGLSLNVAMDLSPFLQINPCGYAGLETVDMRTMGVDAAQDEVARKLANYLTEQWQRP